MSKVIVLNSWALVPMAMFAFVCMLTTFTALDINWQTAATVFCLLTVLWVGPTLLVAYLMGAI
jgi:hypothetical protein